MSSEEKDVPQNTQDLTVFVQNLLQQMVRCLCFPGAPRGAQRGSARLAGLSSLRIPRGHAVAASLF
jgi:hypothetical protein